MIKEELNSLDSNNIEDKSSFWDFVKCKIRTLTISYCTALSKRKRNRERILMNKLEELEKRLAPVSQSSTKYIVGF